jgi:hypothetical protein
MSPDAGVDPCEVDFKDYRLVEGILLPHEMAIHFGDREFGTLRIDQWQLESLTSEDDS